MLAPFVSGWLALAGLVAMGGAMAVQSFGHGQGLSLDARAAGLGFAVVALLLRAPFLVVVVGAAAVAAGLRALG